MQILNTSKEFSADESGRVYVKDFSVSAGQRAYLTLTAPKVVQSQLEFQIKRVAGKVDCECPASQGKAVMPDHTQNGKPVVLGFHDDNTKIASDRVIIDWPGQYYIGSNMTAAMNDPCNPVIIELHIEQMANEVTA